MTSVLRVQANKELRELLPWWGAVVTTVVACALLKDRGAPWLFQSTFTGAGLLAYAAGAISLGALSIGHEYSNHTLPSSLMLPVPRSQVLLVKLAVLLPLLMSLGAIVSIMFGVNPLSNTPRVGMIGRVPLLCAICLTPWLTMVFRGPLAGAVLSGAAAVLLFPLGWALGVPYTAVPPITLLLAGVGVMMTWRTFVRLQVGGGSPIWARVTVRQHATSSDTAVRRTQHPLWLLLHKELRIQTMTCVAAGLFVVFWLATSLAVPISERSTIFLVAWLYQGLVVLMAGSLAIAEERRFGTVEWQTLLPWAHFKQWTVKLGTTLSLALVLAGALPKVLDTVLPWPWDLDYSAPSALLGYVAALYISSLSRTGFRAFLATVPTIGIASLIWVFILDALARYSREALQPLANQIQAFVRFDRADFHWLTGDAAWWVVGGFALLILHFASVNYRHGPPSRPRVARQFLWMSAYVVVATLLASLVSAMFVGFLSQAR